jgi:SAM-dependent methyltransferase
MCSPAFDQFASSFARATDRRIRKGRYVRGELFLAAVRRAVKPGGVLLDYGCGPGRLSRMFALNGYRVLGVDPSAAMIAEATAQETQGLPLEFRVRSSLTHEIPSELDAIVCSSVIEYISKPRELLTCCSDHLRDSGHLIISFANRTSFWGKIVLGRKSAFSTAEMEQWTWPSFRLLLQDTGFRAVHGPHYFESPFDVSRVCRFLSNNRWIGSLGLVIAQKA